MAAIICHFVVAVLFAGSCMADNDTVCQRYYPRYHFSPPHGWMNDPNGFCKFKGEYHLFYQHNPFSSRDTGTIHWGHTKSLDLFHWEHLPIALYPNNTYDKDGVYSGSAFIEDDILYLFYTGNVNDPAEQQQALAVSTDGLNIEKYENNPIIKGDGYQPNLRDPQVWKNDDTYYMVLGNSFNTSSDDTLGRVLLYTSKDMLNWTQVSVIAQSNGTLGYMWECPTFFKLGNIWMLLFSPQGVAAVGDQYNNIYQTGYIAGTFDYSTNEFKPITEFREMDCGHDYYATQYLNENGSVIVIAWFDMWEHYYPERNDGFAGTMVIPRNITLGSDGVIYQKPVDSISNAIGENLYSGKGTPGTIVVLPDKTAQIKIKAPCDSDFEIYIGTDNQTVVLRYNVTDSKVTLDRGGEDGVRRRAWNPVGELNWEIYVDASSIELFCGNGDITFTSRYFPDGQVKVRLGDISYADEFIVAAMKRTMPTPGK